jgi:Tfp pilus assembly protein PilO
MSIKKDILITIGAGFLILMLFCLVIWLPHHKRLSNARAELAKVSHALGAEMSKASVLTQLNAKVNDMNATIDQMDKRLVEKSDLSILLRKLSAELRRLGIENQTTHTQSPQDFPEYTAIPLTLSFQGQYDQTDVFLRYMENLNYPIFISRLSMQRSPRDSQKLITVNLRLMVFFSPEAGGAS